MRAQFYGDAKARITSLFQVVATKMNLPISVPLGLMMSSGGAASQPVSPGNTPLSEDRVKVRIAGDAHVLLDGEEHNPDPVNNEHYEYLIGGSESAIDNGAASAPMSAGSASAWPMVDQAGCLHPSRPSSTNPPPRKRKRRGSLDEFGEWIIKKGQWRLRVQPRPESPGQKEQRMEIVLHAVKLDAVSGQRGRNAARGFLT